MIIHETGKICDRIGGSVRSREILAKQPEKAYPLNTRQRVEKIQERVQNRSLKK